MTGGSGSNDEAAAAQGQQDQGKQRSEG